MANVPVGFRFLPTDEELVGHYLKHKLQGDHSLVRIIADVDICKFEPWELPERSVVISDDPEWFFFSPRGFKYTNSDRSNRKTRAGYWKATGNDRKIKARGTNDVIGTKKTLVFYKGRVPHGVRTNWVIHEYHAVTFPVNERTFVLCRLKKKAVDDANFEIPAREDILPDEYILPQPDLDLESFLQAPDQTEEYDFPLLQQSSIVIEQEPSFQNSEFPNPYFGNENSSTLFPFENTEEVDQNEFVNSLLADDDVYFSNTDVELACALHDSTPAVRNDTAGSRKYQVMTMSSKPLHGAVPAGTSLRAEHEVNRKNMENICHVDFWGENSSSGDSTSDKTLSINFTTTIDSSPSPPRRFKTKSQPRSENFGSQTDATRRSQIQRKVSSKALSQNEDQKNLHSLESKKYHRNSSRKNLEATSDQSSGISGMSSFFYLETPSLSQNPRPRSVYLVNVIIGIALLIVTTWDVISSGKCY